MDRYEAILDLVEHPNRFTPEEVLEQLSDPEMKEIYILLSDTTTALHAKESVSEEYINQEWERINTELTIGSNSLKSFKLHKNSFLRVASVAAIILFSLAALAFGITISVSLSDKKTNGVSSELSSNSRVQSLTNEDTVAHSDMEHKVEIEPMIFEDTPLDEILKTVSDNYEVSVKFLNPNKAGIHLFYKFDARKSLENIVDQLNTFERISVRIDGDTIIVE